MVLGQQRLQYYGKAGHVYIDFVEEQNGVRRAAIRGVVWASSMHALKTA